MLRVEAAFICREVRDVPGTNLITIVAAGVNAVVADGPFPWILRASCALIISYEAVDFGRTFMVTINIIDEDGESEGPTTFKWSIQHPNRSIPGLPMLHSFHSSLENYTIPKPGLYRIDVAIDGVVTSQTSFAVVTSLD